MGLRAVICHPAANLWSCRTNICAESPRRGIDTCRRVAATATGVSRYYFPVFSLRVSVLDLVVHGALAQRPPPQPTIQCSRLPPLPEDRFKALFAQFVNTSGLRLNDREFIIDGRPVNPWALHRAVFARNGFDSVTANNEWPAVGGVLGFPPFSAGDLTQPPQCAPAIAHRLQQLYNDALRHFEQAYISNAQPHQPTDADYQALLANIPQDGSAMPPNAMGILPRFSHTSGADLEAHRVPPHIVAFVEQHRDHLRRAAQDQNNYGFRGGLTS
ncbi:hypothetical protein EI94DRAFT_1561254, partial [Lactarius quietus]